MNYIDQDDNLLHLSLCTGMGGFDLAAEWAGFTTVAFCECEPFAQKVLQKHWPNTPIIGDIKDVTREKIYTYTMQFTQGSIYRQRDNTNRPDCEQRDWNAMGDDSRNLREERLPKKVIAAQPSVDLITGGIPCQPASIAGKQRGAEDDRWLWPEAIRVLSEIKPTWAVFENPTGILTLGGGMVFDNLLSQMEQEKYEVQPIVIPACAVNAPHRRDRVFIVAHRDSTGLGERRGPKSVRTSLNPIEHDRQVMADSTRRGRREIRNQGASEGTQNSYELLRNHGGLSGEPTTRTIKPGLGGASNGLSSEVYRGELTRADELRDMRAIISYRTRQSYNMLTPMSQSLPIQNIAALEKKIVLPGYENWEGDWEQGVPRVATGVRDRVKRLKCLGNAVVPQQAYPVLQAIANIIRIERKLYGHTDCS